MAGPPQLVDTGGNWQVLSSTVGKNHKEFLAQAKPLLFPVQLICPLSGLLYRSGVGNAVPNLA